jgi:hypothetical protein
MLKTKTLFTHRHLQGPRGTRRRTDHRSGAPVRHHPDPMPRIRWYS